MRHLLTVFLFAAAAMLSLEAYAQSSGTGPDKHKDKPSIGKESRRAERHHPGKAPGTAPAAGIPGMPTGDEERTDSLQQDKKAIDTFVMPEHAEFIDAKSSKMYYLRRVNIHGAEHFNHDILRSASGLVPGDSVYLPSSFVQNAMTRLWSQRYFADIKIGATMEGDSVDLEVMLKERPRVVNWAITGVPKSKAKDLLEEFKLQRGRVELSDYIIDKNIKLLKKHFGDKGFRNC